jgi:hypothetical protein
LENLFEGYDEKFKVNRITVSACYDCNNKYSPTDEQFRNMIGIIAKRKENKKIAEKSIRSIKRKNGTGRGISFDSFGKVTGITFDEVPIENFHKKIFKGLFLHQFGTVINDDYDIYVNIDEDDWSEPTMGFLGYLKGLFEFKQSGHIDILKYSIQPFRLGIENKFKEDLEPTENENIFIGYMDFNKEHASLVIAVRKGYLEEIKKRKGCA